MLAEGIYPSSPRPLIPMLHTGGGRARLQVLLPRVATTRGCPHYMRRRRRVRAGVRTYLVRPRGCRALHVYAYVAALVMAVEVQCQSMIEWSRALGRFVHDQGAARRPGLPL